jgi:hypothetical protein
MLKGVYDFLKTGVDAGPIFQVSFTAEAALWRAQSETGWYSTLVEKKHFEVQVSHWDAAITTAVPIDVEELGVLVMAML